MSGFQYSILRFMPDPNRQEFMNVGVVVTPETGAPVVRVLPKAHAAPKARALGYEGALTFIESIASDVLAWGDSSRAVLHEASHEWGGTVRFSEVRGALATSPNSLCEDLFARYVAVPSRSPKTLDARDRRAARRVTRSSLKSLLPAEVVKSTPTVMGRVEEHKFDLGIQNGKLLHAVSTLSFEIKTDRLLAAEVDACAWAIADVREAQPALPISVITIGVSQRKLLTRAQNVYRDLGATLVAESEIDDWAAEVEHAVSQHLEQLRSH